MKRIASILWAVLLPLSFTGCGTQAITSTIDMEQYMKSVKECQGMVIYEKPNCPNYQSAYADYLQNDLPESIRTYSYASFSLINLDDNETPELFIDTGAEAGGEIAVTYADGKLTELQLSRCGTQYIEKSGLLYTNTGHMGWYPVHIRKLENGKFYDIASGLYQFRAAGEGSESYYQLDVDGNPIEDYKWEGESVTKTEFYEEIDAVFNREQGVFCSHDRRNYPFQEIMSVLNTGVCSSDGHRYELIQADVTWAEADALCKEKGGYLATITAPEERETIENQIRESNLTDTAFFVGYHTDGDSWFCWKGIEDTCLAKSLLNGFSKFSAPDYEEIRKNWNFETDDSGLLRYYSNVERTFLFYVPNDFLSYMPNYSGKLGYICEYDS